MFSKFLGSPPKAAIFIKFLHKLTDGIADEAFDHAERDIVEIIHLAIELVITHCVLQSVALHAVVIMQHLENV